MLAVRRSALRILSTSSPFAAKSRTITSLSSQSLLRSKPASQSVFLQRRWATDGAAAQEQGETPVSKLQPTPEEEVENAIHEDNAVAAESSPASESAAQAPASDSQGSNQQTSSDQVNSAFFGGARDAGARDDIPIAQRIREPKPAIYVGNLFFDVTEDDLSRELSRFGKVENVKLIKDARGLSKGFGYVDFATTDAATAAIEALHQQLFEGRRVVVQYAAYRGAELQRKNYNSLNRSSPTNAPSKTLFIGNMSYEMTDRDLNELFRGVKNVVDVRVAIDRRTGQPRGFAHADFIDVKSAMEAQKLLSSKETYGRRLRIDYSYGNNTAFKNQRPPPTESGSGSTPRE